MPQYPKLYTRQVLLSTGEFTTEAVIRINGTEFYDTVPIGLTVGLKEQQSCRGDINNKNCLSRLNSYQNILGLTQEKFDKFVGNICNAQTSVAFSLAYLKYEAYKHGFTEKQIFKFLAQKFNKATMPPKIISNILNGGKHSENRLAFCEFMIIPQDINIEKNVRIASEIYLDLKNILINKLGNNCLYIGREGGFSPLISNVEIAISLLNSAILKRNKGRCHIAIDVAANSFSQLNNDGEYVYAVNEKFYTTSNLVKYYSYLLNKFPTITYLEDPFHENDIDGWQQIKDILGDKILIVADDLTNSTLLYLKKHNKYFNACILKADQAGSISKLIESYKFCVKNNIKTVISQRSGETDSDIIAHLAVGLGSDYIKAGAPARERIIKYNSLIRMEDLVYDRN